MNRSLRASPTVSIELKFPVELNPFSDASRVSEPANEILVTCRFRKNTEHCFHRSITNLLSCEVLHRAKTQGELLDISGGGKLSSVHFLPWD